MKLDTVTVGRVYVDVNVFYMYLRPDPEHLSSLRVFLERVTNGDITAYTSVLTMDELFYRFLLARIKDTYERNPLDVLREDAEEAIERCSSEIEVALRKLVRLPHLELAPVLKDDFPRMLDNINNFALLPRDALHIAVMQRLGVDEIATDDADFDRVTGLQRHWLFNAPDSASDQEAA
jgi:predicted nucleic acid-binding protein